MGTCPTYCLTLGRAILDALPRTVQGVRATEMHAHVDEKRSMRVADWLVVAVHVGWPVDEVESVPGLADEAVIGLTRKPLGLPSPHASAVGQTRRHAIPVKPFGDANVCLRELLGTETAV